MFHPDIVNAAKEHARREYPREAVGYVVGETYVPQTNIAANPLDTFHVRPEAWLEHGKVAAVIHSHPRGEAYPSAADMRHQVESAVPWGIIVCDGERATDPVWFGDQVPAPPLTGTDRYFRHGVTDCYSLCRDYYRTKHGIIIKEHPRDWEWWLTGQNLYGDGFRETGFREIKAQDVQPGDMFLACVGSRKIQDAGIPNHGGVYLGGAGDMILHHLTGERPVDFSRVAAEEYGLRWLKYVKHWIRHKDM